MTIIEMVRRSIRRMETSDFKEMWQKTLAVIWFFGIWILTELFPTDPEFYEDGGTGVVMYGVILIIIQFVVPYKMWQGAKNG